MHGQIEGEHAVAVGWPLQHLAVTQRAPNVAVADLAGSLGGLRNTPVTTALAANGPRVPGLLGNVATLKRESVLDLD